MILVSDKQYIGDQMLSTPSVSNGFLKGKPDSVQAGTCNGYRIDSLPCFAEHETERLKIPPDPVQSQAE